MNKKAMIVLPAMVVTLVCTSSNEINTYLGINSIYITYHSTSDGYFDDGSGLKTEKKSFKVRRGIMWSRRNLKERPTSDPKAYDSDSLVFNKYWCFRNGKVVEDDYEITGNIDVYASYGFQPTSGNFDTDNWAQLASVTAQGVATTLSTYNLTKEQCIGKTKTLNLGDVVYTARIIGVDHDPLADDSGNNAVFTFEFVETIDPKPYALEMSKKNVYKSSFLRSYLNGQFKNQFSTGLKRAMKLVKKTTNAGNGSDNFPSTNNYDVNNEYIFPISLKEMNASKYNEKLSQASTDYIFPTDEISTEGSVYDYYNKDIASLPDISKKNKTSGLYLPYWTRSPELHANQYTWLVNSKNVNIYEIGQYSEEYEEQASLPVSDSIAIAPCFCI